MSMSKHTDLLASTPQPAFSSKKFIWPILAVLLLGLVVIALDRDNIVAALRRADWRVIPPALLFTALSYLCVSYTYTMVAHIWGIRMPRRTLTEICFVTTSLNHVVRSGGVAGYSVRYLLMNRHGVPFNEVISSSFVHFYLTSLDMLAMLPIALAYLIYNTELPRNLTLLLAALALAAVLLAIGATVLVFSDRLRVGLIQIGSRLGRLVLRRDFSGILGDFNAHMNHGVQMLRQQAGRSGLVMLLTFIDYTASVIVLGLCFNAFGPALKPGALVATFMIGIMAGVVSALPGGIGVQEGSMTGISILFGATFEQAILAALLFRVIYYFVPYTISPLFYWRLLRRPALDYAD